MVRQLPDLNGKITSLSDEKGEFVSYSLILGHICSYLDNELTSEEPFAVSRLKPLWFEYSQLSKKQVEIVDNETGDKYSGIVNSLTDSGSLVLELVSGEMKEFTQGDAQIRFG